ncbi:MAG TPA: hypothetical protein VK783_15905 [Bacteroidia bacterium]|nr:hypothetical protein [Bacteroidia bacterium]
MRRTLIIAVVTSTLLCACNLITKPTIPPGAYTLEKSQAHGFDKLIHTVEQAGTLAKGLGNRLIVTGDTIESIDVLSSLVKDATGGSNKFAVENTTADNQFLLDLPGNKTLIQLTSQNKLKIFVGQDSLVYDKE